MTTLDTVLSKKHPLLPDGWRYVRLGDVCEIVAGQSPPGSTYRKSPEGLPFFQGKADFSDHHPVARVWCIAPKMIALPGDILISVRAPVGPTNIADVKCCIGRGLAAIRCGDTVDRDFLLAALRHLEAHLALQGSGSTFDSISRRDLEGLLIPLPPLQEQKRIAAILREQMAAVEKARAAAEARLEAAKALPAAFMHQYLEKDDSRQWPLVALESICAIEARQIDPTLPEYRDLPHVNGENIESGTGRLFGIKSAAEDRMTSGKYVFDPGVVLYSKLRPYLRKVALADFRGLCSADIYPLRFDPLRVDYRFALWVLLARPFTDYAVGVSQRARMPKLNREQLFAWHFPLPSMDRQRQIAEALNRCIDRVQQLTVSLLDELKTINTLPAALLRQAFNGEL